MNWQNQPATEDSAAVPPSVPSFAVLYMRCMHPVSFIVIPQDLASTRMYHRPGESPKVNGSR